MATFNISGLDAAGDETSVLEKPIYEHNVSVLKEAFGPDWQSSCHVNENSCGDECDDFICTNGNLYARSMMNGLVSVGGTGWSCHVYSNGRAKCSG